MTLIDDLARFVGDGNPQHVPLRVVHATIEAPHAFFNYDPSVRAPRLHVVPAERAGRANVSSCGIDLIDNVLRIKGIHQKGTGRQQRQRPSRRAIPLGDMHHRVHISPQGALQASVHLRRQHVEETRALQIGNRRFREQGQRIRFHAAQTQRRNERRCRCDRIRSGHVRSLRRRGLCKGVHLLLLK